MSGSRAAFTPVQPVNSIEAPATNRIASRTPTRAPFAATGTRGTVISLRSKESVLCFIVFASGVVSSKTDRGAYDGQRCGPYMCSVLFYNLLDALMGEKPEAAPLVGGAEDAPVEEGRDIAVRHLERSSQVAYAIELR